MIILSIYFLTIIVSLYVTKIIANESQDNMLISSVTILRLIRQEMTEIIVVRIELMLINDIRARDGN